MANMRAGNAGSCGTFPRWRLKTSIVIATRYRGNVPQVTAFPARAHQLKLELVVLTWCVFL